MSGDLRRVLVVGGSAEASLALCRWLGQAGERACLLRWHEARSFADASRHCEESLWLGAPDDGVERWLQWLSGAVTAGGYTDLWPVDALAHELLCSGRWQAPAGARLVGPAPEDYARCADRCAAQVLAAAAGLTPLPGVHLCGLAQPDAPVLPCVARPQRAVAVVADEPAHYSTKRVDDVRALDAKLRDDLPRVGVLLQSPLDGSTRDLFLAARDGELLSCTGDDDPALRSAAAAIVRALRWTGLLHLQCVRHGNATHFVDLRPGSDGWRRIPAAVGAAMAARVLGVPAPPPTARGRLDVVPALLRATQAVTRLAGKLAERARIAAWRPGTGRAPQHGLRPGDSVLFVCKGNINRSLVAEQALRARGYGRVASAGLLGMSGRRPSAPAERYVEGVLGRPAAGLRSSSVRLAMERLGQVDIVVCFERRHVLELLRRHPGLKGRVHLLTRLTDGSHGPPDVPDPHGATEAEHRRCFDRIVALINRATARETGAGSLAAGAR